jgi:hypothetical protein
MYNTNASKKELAFTTALGVGSKGAAVKKLQEWLNLQGQGILIDGDFGPATLAALKGFQTAQGLKVANTLNAQTWVALVQPMSRALSATTGASAAISTASLAVAREHLAEHPLEAGGDNCGPWVRLYTGGRDGKEWRWCAGFVSFVLSQACDQLLMRMPIKGSLSCDTLAAQAQAADRFVSGKSVVSGIADAGALGKCAVFLVRRTPGDWTHTGFAFNFTASTFDTIEGNTNDDGNANGYEVCRRIRKVSDGYDFVKLD